MNVLVRLDRRTWLECRDWRGWRSGCGETVAIDGSFLGGLAFGPEDGIPQDCFASLKRERGS